MILGIGLRNYRNIREAGLRFTPGVNLFLGDNAQGKTNALEAIGLFAISKSFRGAADRDFIGPYADFMRADLYFNDCANDMVKKKITVFRDRPRTMNLNGEIVKTAVEFIGRFRAVIFTPEHLTLVSGPPAVRRSFMDGAISQEINLMAKTLMSYNRCLKQRCAILKGPRTAETERLLDSVTEQMAEFHALCSQARIRFLREISGYAQTIMSDLSDGRELLEVRFVDDFPDEPSGYFLTKKYTDKFIADCHAARERDWASGNCSVGLHHDDFDLYLNGKSAKRFASQGQMRSIALALKLAEGQRIRRYMKIPPVYLLDDVLSELDDRRQRFLLESQSDAQMIITACNEIPLDPSRVNVIHVKDGVFT